MEVQFGVWNFAALKFLERLHDLNVLIGALLIWYAETTHGVNTKQII